MYLLLATILNLASAAPADSIEAPRLEAEIVVDGFLDEQVWAQAVVLRGFSQYLPVDGRPAEDSTVVRVPIQRPRPPQRRVLRQAELSVEGVSSEW